MNKEDPGGKKSGQKQRDCRTLEVFKEFLKLYKYPASNPTVLSRVNKQFGLSTTSTPLRGPAFGVSDLTKIPPAKPHDADSSTVDPTQENLGAGLQEAAGGSPAATNPPPGSQRPADQRGASGPPAPPPPPPPGPARGVSTGMATPNLAEIPRTWHDQHCDPSSQPGKVPAVLADYANYIFVPDQSEAGKNLYAEKGCAIYVANRREEEVRYSSARLKTLWSRQAIVFQALTDEKLKLDDVADPNNLSTSEKAQLEVVKDQLKDIMDVHAKIQALAAPFSDYLKGSSVLPFLP